MIIRRPTVQDCFIPEQYTSSPKIIKKCLHETLAEGIMGTQVNAPNENEDMRKKERENIIRKHMEQFTTKYYESDRRWHSFLPDDTSPRKMKPIAKRKWEDLEEAIVEFYKVQDYAEKRKRLTLRTLFPEWFAYKWNDTNNSSYMKRINHDWKRFYENDDIVDRPIVELTTFELKNWAKGKIASEKLTKKLYYNMTVIIRQSLDYLVELEELPSNPFSNFKINSALFTPTEQKDAEYEVFNENEEQPLKALAIHDFETYQHCSSSIAVAINFSLGLRVGELVALKWNDLKDHYLHIRRMEQRQYEHQSERRYAI